jgi:hypothetical protein
MFFIDNIFENILIKKRLRDIFSHQVNALKELSIEYFSQLKGSEYPPVLGVDVSTQHRHINGQVFFEVEIRRESRELVSDMGGEFASIRDKKIIYLDKREAKEICENANTARAMLLNIAESPIADAVKQEKANEKAWLEYLEDKFDLQVEDYSDPEKGITYYEAWENALEQRINSLEPSLQESKS